MMRQKVYTGQLAAGLRECWILASDRRKSKESPWDGVAQIHAIAVEWVVVDESCRRRGHLKRFLESLCADERFEMVVVEGVQNPILAEALLHWGWEWDPKVMDFYMVRK